MITKLNTAFRDPQSWPLDLQTGTRPSMTPVESCNMQLVADDREFHSPIKQWVCKKCKTRLLYHNNELTPADTRPLRISGKELLASDQDKTGVQTILLMMRENCAVYGSLKLFQNQLIFLLRVS